MQNLISQPLSDFRKKEKNLFLAAKISNHKQLRFSQLCFRKISL